MDDVTAAPSPSVQLLNCWPAPLDEDRGGRAGPQDERPVWVTAHWRTAFGVHEEEIPAVAERESGALVLCRWVDGRVGPDGAWMHLEDVEPRG